MRTERNPSTEPTRPSPPSRVETVRPETRQRYLAVAAELARQDIENEPAFAHLASHIRLTDVARHLGVSRTRLYRLWETQHDYWRDLVTYLITQSVSKPEGETPLPPTPPVVAGDINSLVEYLRVRFEHRQRHAVQDPYLIIRVGLAGYPKVPELAVLLDHWHRARRQNIAERIAALLQVAGRTPVAPLTHHDLASMVWLLVVGTAMLGRTSPAVHHLRLQIPADDPLRTRPWSLLAYAVRSLLIELTESAPADTPPAKALKTERQLRRVNFDLSAWLPAWSDEQLEAIRAGAELFTKSIDLGSDSRVGSRVHMGHVTLARVARAAGVSRRQVHNVWPTQEDLSRDLISYLREQDHKQYFGQFDSSVAQAITSTDGGDTPTIDTIGLRVVEKLFTERLVIPEDPTDPAPQVPMVLQPHLGDRIMHEESRRALDRLQTFQQGHIDALTQVFGVRIRDGLTTEHLSWLIVAASNGSVALHHIDPRSMRRGIPYRGGHYSALSIACQALIDHSIVAADVKEEG